MKPNANRVSTPERTHPRRHSLRPVRRIPLVAGVLLDLIGLLGGLLKVRVGRTKSIGAVTEVSASRSPVGRRREGEEGRSLVLGEFDEEGLSLDGDEVEGRKERFGEGRVV